MCFSLLKALSFIAIADVKRLAMPAKHSRVELGQAQVMVHGDRNLRRSVCQHFHCLLISMAVL